MPSTSLCDFGLKCKNSSCTRAHDQSELYCPFHKTRGHALRQGGDICPVDLCPACGVTGHNVDKCPAFQVTWFRSMCEKKGCESKHCRRAHSLKQLFCNYCNDFGHSRSTCTHPFLRCVECGDKGHAKGNKRCHKVRKVRIACK